MRLPEIRSARWWVARERQLPIGLVDCGDYGSRGSGIMQVISDATLCCLSARETPSPIERAAPTRDSCRREIATECRTMGVQHPVRVSSVAGRTYLITHPDRARAPASSRGSIELHHVNDKADAAPSAARSMSAATACGITHLRFRATDSGLYTSGRELQAEAATPAATWRLAGNRASIQPITSDMTCSLPMSLSRSW